MSYCKLVLIGCAWLFAGCSSDREPLPPIAPPENIRWFLEAIRPVVGPDFRECNSDLRQGEVPRAGPSPSKTLSEWFDCAREASVARRPFVIALEQTPLEGWNVTGILGGPDGTMRAFNYYEGCCRPPTPQLRAGVCALPFAKVDNSWPYGISCANEDERGLVPMPELRLRAEPLPSDLSARLQSLAGEHAIDCGFELADASNPHLRSPALLKEAFDCGRFAIASGRGFWILIPSGAFDAPKIHGLAAPGSGAAREFHYDTAPCRGPGCPRPIEVTDCERPRIVPEREEAADFVCGSVSMPPAPPSRRRPGP